MGTFVITQAKHVHGKLTEVKIHQVEVWGHPQLGLDAGEVMDASDVANLLAGGDDVYVGIVDGVGVYRAGPSVIREVGTDELFCMENGGMNSDALRTIPQF